MSPLTTTVFFLLTLLSAAVSDDVQTLLSIKSIFQSSNPQLFSSWNPNTTSFCSFPGITCNRNNLVTELILHRQNLTGPLPLTDICQLTALETLSLGFNSLSGPVTADLNNCSALKYLDLGNNFFTGIFPEIPSLTNLIHLYANNSGFSGNFPWQSLQNMTALKNLSLGDNPFKTTPFPSVVFNLTNLNLFYLSNCSIGGQIPEEIGNLVNLISLELSQNYLIGEIPAGITKLKNLQILEIYWNNFTGEFPPGLGNLSNLQFFDASTNYLQGNLSEIRFLNNLISLQLFENNFSGEIPAEFGEFRNLVNLSLYMNSLTGELPQTLGSYSEVNFIDVSENFLTGPIPPDMCKRGTMNRLLMVQNNLTGEIPDSYANCTTLRRFRLKQNRLSGKVPDGIWGLPKALHIDLSYNELEGGISSDIGNAKSLGQLLISNNRFSGNLPGEISSLPSLVSIDLSNNQFSGEIPGGIGDLIHLNKLLFQGNGFTGEIPDSLSSCRSINEINLAGNGLSGEIPASLGSLPSLNFLNLSRNQLLGSIPESLSSVRLSILDLSDNRLTGVIPYSFFPDARNGSFDGNVGLCCDSGDVHGFPSCQQYHDMSHHVWKVLIGLVVAFVVLIVLLGYFCWLKWNRVAKTSLKGDSWDLRSFHVLSFGEDEILDSIKQENLIGKGGSGNVYRVSLRNGKEFAVKHIRHSDDDRRYVRSSAPILGKRVGSRKSREFEAEVQILSSIRHVNVVKLYCSITSDDSSLLVYEYMSNGSLWDRLHTCEKLALDWETRYEVALGAAKGLEHLHHGCDRAVIHRDVKSSNILLDQYLKPKIADFGLAKMAQENSIMESTQVIAGTHGYIAPEYAYTNKVTEKSDVYSFGVVLMELVTGKMPIDQGFGENRDIVDWVCGKLTTKESIMSIVDSNIDKVDREIAIQVLKVAIVCTARNPSCRPTMRSVVKMLEEAQPCQVVKIIATKDEF